MKEPTGRRSSRPEHSELHKLLILACPPTKDGSQGSISGTLAPKLGISFQSIYQWIRRDQIPPNHVKPLVKLAEGRITRDDVLKFVI